MSGTGTPGTDERARVFLSWSGEPSRLLANALADGMRLVSDRVEPWLSEGLDPGVEWAKELVPHIRKARLAVLCLTHYNLGASWIAFETGAFYSSRLRGGVIPFLLDFPPGDLPFPLGLFQSLPADWKGSKALFTRVGQLVDIDPGTVETLFATKIWPQLGDQLTTIRNLKPQPDTKATPKLANLANAFFLGHDLRWTLDALSSGATVEDVKHGLVQTLHQATDLGLGQHDHILVLKQKATEVLGLAAEEWTESVREGIETALRVAFERLGGLMISLQPGYRPYDPANQPSWIAIQAQGRA
jgi:TIR domain